MSKIGIITLWDNNVGSALQCLVVSEKIRDLGYEPVIIQRKENTTWGKFIERLCYYLQWGLLAVTDKNKARNVQKSINNQKQHSRNFKEIGIINNFVKSRVKLEVVDYYEIKKRSKTGEFAAFISGSDQIWNYSFGVILPFNYLRFAPKKKRLAISASIGVDMEPPNKHIFIKYIKGYSLLSVREESAASIINTFVGNKPLVIVDPCLQIDANKWREISKNEKDSVPKKKYIITYFLDNVSSEVLNSIRKYKTRYIVVNLQWENNKNNVNMVDFNISPNPLEFINLIDNAEVVLTDSFHGVVFSIIFQKKFWCYKRHYKHGVDQSTRVKSLLTEVGLLDRFESSSSVVDVDDNIDYFNCEKVILKKQREAAAYWKSVEEHVNETVSDKS